MAVLLWTLGLLCLLPALTMLAAAVRGPAGFTAEHLVRVGQDPTRLLFLLTNTAKVTAGAVSLALALGIPLGFLCFRTDLPGRRVLVVACLVAGLVPFYVTATAWMAWLGMHRWMYSPWSAAWMTGLACTPLTALITGAGFATARPDLEESARLDAGPLRVILRVALPQNAGGIAMAALLVAALSLWDITIPDILMIRTLGEEVFTQFQLGAGPGSAAALSLPLLIVVAALWWALAGTVRRYGAALDSDPRPPRPFLLGAWRWPMLALVLGGLLLLLGLPFFALVKAVGTPAALLTAWRTAGEELRCTLGLTLLSATLACALALPAAWATVRCPRLRGVILGVTLLLLAVPAPVIGIGLIQLLNRPGLPGLIYDTQAGVAAAYVIRTLPLCVCLLIPAVRSMPRDLEDAAELEGATWLRSLRSVVFPACRGPLLATCFIACTVILSEMGASFLVVPPGRSTLSVRFFNLIHCGVYPDAAGICLILLALAGLAALAASALLWPRLTRLL